MITVLIPYQKDLHANYKLDGINNPIILNQRFVDYINSHNDMIGYVIPYDDKYINMLANEENCAVLIPGGNNIGDVPERDEFEFKLIDTCFKNDIPLIGICKGMQMINVYLNGSLKEVEDHWQEDILAKSVHNVNINEGIFLDKFVKREIPVNSFHKLALDRLGEGIKVEGVSPDDVIECVSVEGKPMIGVQWHPSFNIDNYYSQQLLNLFYELSL